MSAMPAKGEEEIKDERIEKAQELYTIISNILKESGHSMDIIFHVVGNLMASLINTSSDISKAWEIFETIVNESEKMNAEFYEKARHRCESTDS